MPCSSNSCLLHVTVRRAYLRRQSTKDLLGAPAEDNLEMILHEFVLENVETELWRKWKNQG